VKFVFLAAGSAGDVHPFFAFGRILRNRGHEVVLFAAAEFEAGALAAGLRFEQAISEERFDFLMKDPRLWDSRKGFPFLMQEAVLPGFRERIGRVRAELRAPDTVLAGSTLAVVARTVAELDGTPMATIHMSPAPLRTLHRLPVFEGARFVNSLPQWGKRAFWWVGDRVLDPQYVPDLNQERAALGLPPLHRPLNGWWDSPDLVLGLWPEWFAPRQPDFSPALRMTGFPFGGDDHRPLDPALSAWLDAGEPPIVFTHGSANIQAAPFFEASVEVAREHGGRALLATRNVEDIPTVLPEGVRHTSYAPFGTLLPRAAALVSHGGIGTVAEGLRAGIPQLVVPMAHDQHDNASRLSELGVGRSISPRRYSAGSGARVFRDLLGKGMRERASALAQRFEGVDGAIAVADELEALAGPAR